MISAHGLYTLCVACCLYVWQCTSFASPTPSIHGLVSGCNDIGSLFFCNFYFHVLQHKFGLYRRWQMASKTFNCSPWPWRPRHNTVKEESEYELQHSGLANRWLYTEDLLPRNLRTTLTFSPALSRSPQSSLSDSLLPSPSVPSSASSALSLSLSLCYPAWLGPLNGTRPSPCCHVPPCALVRWVRIFCCSWLLIVLVFQLWAWMVD